MSKRTHVEGAATTDVAELPAAAKATKADGAATAPAANATKMKLLSDLVEKSALTVPELVTAIKNGLIVLADPAPLPEGTASWASFGVDGQPFSRKKVTVQIKCRVRKPPAFPVNKETQVPVVDKNGKQQMSVLIDAETSAALRALDADIIIPEGARNGKKWYGKKVDVPIETVRDDYHKLAVWSGDEGDEITLKFNTAKDAPQVYVAHPTMAGKVFMGSLDNIERDHEITLQVMFQGVWQGKNQSTDMLRVPPNSSIKIHGKAHVCRLLGDADEVVEAPTTAPAAAAAPAAAPSPTDAAALVEAAALLAAATD